MSEPTSEHQKTNPLFGWMCIVLGSGVLLIAFGVIPVDPSTVYAPYSILGLCGLVFAIAGIMILMGENSKYNSLGAAAILVCFAICGGWVALFASPDSIEGGLPFLSQEVNGVLGKIVFGGGALISATLSVYAWRLFREGR